MSVDCVGNGLHMPVSAYTVSFVDTDQWTSSKAPYGRPACPDIILRSSVAKIKRNLKMTVFQEMGIKSKLLNQNSMILVSFSSAEDALFNESKKSMTLLARKVLKISRSAFFGTPGIFHAHIEKYCTICMYRYLAVHTG